MKACRRVFHPCNPQTPSARHPAPEGFENASALGRFVSVDPVLFGDPARNVQDAHQYAYAGNRPMVTVDVAGMAPAPYEVAETVESSSAYQAAINPPVPSLLKTILKVAYGPVMMPMESTVSTVSTVLNIMKLGTGVAEATQTEGADMVVPILQDVQRFSEGFTTLGGAVAPLARGVPRPTGPSPVPKVQSGTSSYNPGGQSQSGYSKWTNPTEYEASNRAIGGQNAEIQAANEMFEKTGRWPLNDKSPGGHMPMAGSWPDAIQPPPKPQPIP